MKLKLYKNINSNGIHSCSFFLIIGRWCDLFSLVRLRIESTDGGCAVPGWEDVAMRTSTRVIPLGWKWTRHRRHRKRKLDCACLLATAPAHVICLLHKDGISRTFQRILLVVHRHWGQNDLKTTVQLRPSFLTSDSFVRLELDSHWLDFDKKSVPVCLFLFLSKKKGVKLYSWALLFRLTHAWAYPLRPPSKLYSLKCLCFLFPRLRNDDVSESAIKDYGHHPFIEREPYTIDIHPPISHAPHIRKKEVVCRTKHIATYPIISK